MRRFSFFQTLKFSGLLTVTLMASSTSASAMTINLTWDSYVTSSPNAVQIEAAVTKAMQTIASHYTNPITINIQVGWGEMLGQPMAGGVLGESGLISYLPYSSVSQLEQLLRSASPLSADDNLAYSHFPAASLYSGFPAPALANAQEKALGLMPGTATALDGYVSFATAYPFTFDDTNGVASGTYDLIGTAEHEISEILGRHSAIGLTSDNVGPMLLDLFRYSAPGVLSFTWGTPAYFSIDGGVTDLRDFSTSGDPQDWSGGTDPSDCAGFGYAGVVQGFSSVDFMLLDVIGYSTVAMATPVNGQCGPTNGVTTGTAPTSGLCNQGTASSVNTTSTNFTWSCMGSGGGSTASCSAPMPVVAPAAATNLHASVTSTTSKGKHATTTYQVNLGWSQGGGVTSDKIYRATGSGSFALISTSSSGITSFVDKNVTQGTTYIYYVIAANPGGVSPASTTVVITP